MKKFLKKYQHLWILSYFIIYLIWFNYVEKAVTTRFHVIHMTLDDYIPFCEYFVIPYFMWFGYVAWGVAYTALRNRTDFYKLCGFLFTGMTVFLIASTLYPNGHDLRPLYFSHHNIFTTLCGYLYSIDTPTNLFPSIHVYNSLAIYFGLAHSKKLQNKKWIKNAALVLTICIILSTMFLKQHSVFDVLTAFALAAFMYSVCYGSISVAFERRRQKRIPARQL